MAKQVKQAIVAAVVVFAVATGVGFLGSIGITGGFAPIGATLSSAAATAFAYAKLTFIGTLAAGVIGKLTSKGIEASRDNFGTKVTTRSAIAPRQIIYGECRVGGIMTQINTTGTDNNRLSMFIVVAGHAVDSQTGVRLNDTDVTTSSATVSGETVHTVTSSEFTNTNNNNSFGSGRLIRFTFHDGTQNAHDGLARATLGSSFVPDTHKFKDCAYFYFEMIYDPEKLPNIPNISFKIKGKKVHDPRDAAAADAWSDNPALIIRDYITDTTYGLKATSDEVNDTTAGGGFASAANTCDQDVTLADGSTTEKRYRANGFTNMSASGEGVLEGLISSCAGSITYTNGKFNLFVGAAQTASLTITDDDLLEPITVTTNERSGELYNAVKAVFVDSTNSFQTADTPIFTDSTFLSNDTPTGESQANYRKQLETQLPFTTTHTMAQRLARAQLISQRFNTGLSVLVPLGFLRLQPKDWVSVTNSRLSFSSKKFEVVNLTLEATTQEETPVMACRLTLKEADPSTYNFATNAYTAPIATGTNLATGDFSIAAPTNLAVASANTVEGVTNKASAVVTWTNNTSDAILGTEIYFATDGSTFQSAGSVGKGTTTFSIQNVVIGDTITVKVRHFLFNGAFGDFSSTAQVAIALGVSITAPSSISATTGKPLLITVTWTNPNQSNIRAMKLYRTTTNSAPTDDSTVVGTFSGEPNKKMTAIFGKHDGLTAGTDFFFWVRSVDHQGNQSSLVGSATGNFVHVQAADIVAGTLTSASGVFGAINAGDITVGNLDANIIRLNGNTLSVTNDGLTLNNFDVFTHANANTIGIIDGIAGESGSVSEYNDFFRTGYTTAEPFHIASIASSGNYAVGDVLGASSVTTLSGDVPLFSHQFTTANYSGNRTFIVQGLVDYEGTSSSSTETLFVMSVRATSNTSNFTSTTASDYLASEKFSASSSYSLGNRSVNAKLTLAGNTTVTVWCFGAGDDVSGDNTAGTFTFDHGAIIVYGLNK